MKYGQYQAEPHDMSWPAGPDFTAPLALVDGDDLIDFQEPGLYVVSGLVTAKLTYTNSGADQVGRLRALLWFTEGFTS